MGIILYNLFLLLYKIGIRVAALWNQKARFWIKGRKNFPSLQNKAKTIWMHCASLGEFEQGRPLLEDLKKLYPSYKIVLSFFSPSGYEVRKDYAGADLVFYLPMDSKTNAKRLIDALNPSLVLWVKYEYWYYYLKTLKERQIPVLLVSGIFRENQPFFKWYGSIWKNMLSCFSQLFLQDERSTALLQSLKMDLPLHMAGDTRFDRVIAIAEKNEPLPLIEAFITGFPVLVAGSTWEEDEIELLHFVKTRQDLKFIIAPHEIHAGNLLDVKKEFPHAIFYSDLQKDISLGKKAQVLIIDNIGILATLYKYATVSFVGGGFGHDGVHNVLEAAVYGKPVVFGPVYEKFAEATGLVDFGAALSVANPLELDKQLNLLFNNVEEIRNRGAKAKAFVYNHKGATNKILDYVALNRLLTN